MKITRVANLAVGMVGWFWCVQGQDEVPDMKPTFVVGPELADPPSPVYAATVARKHKHDGYTTLDFGPGGEGYYLTSASDFAWAFYTGEGAEAEARAEHAAYCAEWRRKHAVEVDRHLRDVAKPMGPTPDLVHWWLRTWPGPHGSSDAVIAWMAAAPQECNGLEGPERETAERDGDGWRVDSYRGVCAVPVGRFTSADLYTHWSGLGMGRTLIRPYMTTGLLHELCAGKVAPATNPDLVEITTTILKSELHQSPARARNAVENTVYQLAVKLFEGMGEHGGLLYGNGHHAAQMLATAAGEMWEARDKRKG